MGTKISVVVPVYNIENYLPKCIESIMNQTYRNLEILLVNDGSTDCSGSICEQYAAMDHRIITIHKENGGLSDARNAGLDVASGDLIGFVDGDDWIDRDMYEVLSGLLATFTAEIAVCRYREISSWGVEDKSSNDLVVCEGTEALQLMVNIKNNYRFGHFVPNKLFKKELIENFRFPVGKLVEDLYFTPSVIWASKRCVYSDSAKYNYLTDRQNSIMNANVSEKMVFDELKGYQELEHFLSGKGVHDGASHIRGVFLSRLINYHYEIKNSSLERKEQLLVILEKMFQSYSKGSSKTFFKPKWRIRIGLFKCSPRFYDEVHGVVKKTRAMVKGIKQNKGRSK